MTQPTERSIGLERKEDGVWLVFSNEFGQHGAFNLGPCQRADGTSTIALELLTDLLMHGVVL